MSVEPVAGTPEFEAVEAVIAELVKEKLIVRNGMTLFIPSWSNVGLKFFEAAWANGFIEEITYTVDIYGNGHDLETRTRQQYAGPWKIM